MFHFSLYEKISFFHHIIFSCQADIGHIMDMDSSLLYATEMLQKDAAYTFFLFSWQF